VAQVAAVKEQLINADYPEEDISKLLRRFTSQHTSLLGWAGFQALQFKRVADVLTHFVDSGQTDFKLISTT
jgi:hypothetical protein